MLCSSPLACQAEVIKSLLYLVTGGLSGISYSNLLYIFNGSPMAYEPEVYVLCTSHRWHTSQIRMCCM